MMFPPAAAAAAPPAGRGLQVGPGFSLGFGLGSLGGRRLGPRGPSVVNRVRCLDPEAWVLDAGDFADTVWRTPLAPSILTMQQWQLAGRLHRPQRQPPGRRVLLLEDVTCDRALSWCEASAAAGGGVGAWESVEEMRAIEGHGECVGDDGVWIRLVLVCVSWSVQT